MNKPRKTPAPVTGPVMLPGDVLVALSQSLTPEAAATVRGFMSGKGLAGNWRFQILGAALVPEADGSPKALG